jgi:hypothetical protein
MWEGDQGSEAEASAAFGARRGGGVATSRESVDELRGALRLDELAREALAATGAPLSHQVWAHRDGPRRFDEYARGAGYCLRSA